MSRRSAKKQARRNARILAVSEALLRLISRRPDGTVVSLDVIAVVAVDAIEEFDRERRERKMELRAVPPVSCDAGRKAVPASSVFDFASIRERLNKL